MTELLADCDHFIAGAALIGGISYFHAYAYDLLATNERIIASSCDAAIKAHRRGQLQKVTYLSSSMVFESATTGLRTRATSARSPPPLSSYGFQKLAVEYFARAAWDQYGLPYTIVRPFNCVGIGETPGAGRRRDPERQREARDEPRRPRPGAEGAQGPGPAAHPRRRATRSVTTPTAAISPGASSTAMAHPAALNEDFNLSTAESHHSAGARRDRSGSSSTATAVQLRDDDPFDYDVQKRVPSVQKAKDLLGFEATTTLDEMLNVVIPWIATPSKGPDLGAPYRLAVLLGGVSSPVASLPQPRPPQGRSCCRHPVRLLGRPA